MTEGKLYRVPKVSEHFLITFAVLNGSKSSKRHFEQNSNAYRLHMTHGHEAVACIAVIMRFTWKFQVS